MSDKKEVIFYRESLMQAIVADIFTFGCLVFSAWFSQESKFWTFVCFVFFILFLCAKTKAKVFTDMKELKEYVGKL